MRLVPSGVQIIPPTLIRNQGVGPANPDWNSGLLYRAIRWGWILAFPSSCWYNFWCPSPYSTMAVDISFWSRKENVASLCFLRHCGTSWFTYRWAGSHVGHRYCLVLLLSRYRRRCCRIDCGVRLLCRCCVCCSARYTSCSSIYHPSFSSKGSVPERRVDEVHSSLLVHIDMIRYLKMLQDPVSFSSLVTRFLCAGEVIKVVEFLLWESNGIS